MLPFIFLFLFAVPSVTRAQQDGRKAYLVGVTVKDGETIPQIKLPTVYIYAPLKFKSNRERKRYDRLVYDVKKTLPLATEIRRIIIETYEVLQILPD